MLWAPADWISDARQHLGSVLLSPESSLGTVSVVVLAVGTSILIRCREHHVLGVMVDITLPFPESGRNVMACDDMSWVESVGTRPEWGGMS